MYELDMSHDGGKSYFNLCAKASLDSCKAVARNMWKDTHQTALFRIYDLDGERLIKVNRPNGSWRMTWVYGNYRPRDQQAN